MSNRPPYLPEGYHAITPYLVVKDAGVLITFCETVLGATSVVCGHRDDGRVQHAEVRVDDSLIMTGTPPDGHDVGKSMLYMYVKDVDATYAAALKAGATSFEVPTDQPYGDRTAAVIDTQDVTWYFATRIAKVNADSED